MQVQLLILGPVALRLRRVGCMTGCDHMRGALHPLGYQVCMTWLGGGVGYNLVSLDELGGDSFAFSSQSHNIPNRCAYDRKICAGECNIRLVPTRACTHADGLCFYRMEDWWTYELCYKKHVRQFHKEKDVLQSEFILGEYHEEASDADLVQVCSTGRHCALIATDRQTGCPNAWLHREQQQHNTNCFAIELLRLLDAGFSCASSRHVVTSCDVMAGWVLFRSSGANDADAGDLSPHLRQTHRILSFGWLRRSGTVVTRDQPAQLTCLVSDVHIMTSVTEA